MPQNGTGEIQVRRLMTAAVQKLEAALDCARPLQGANYPDIADATAETKLREAAEAAVATAESMQSLRSYRTEQLMANATEGRVSELIKWFSLTPQRIERFAQVMTFFRDRVEPEPISLADLSGALGWTQTKPSEEDLITSFRKLDCIRDVRMLIETKVGSERVYTLSDEAKTFIQSGAFASLGVAPQ